MDDGILRRPVAEIMTRQPYVTEPDRIASAALKEMNARRVSQLVVVAEGKPVGVLHLHHLLGAGVA
jgi:arabinose-5-phosphate isomerase